MISCTQVFQEVNIMDFVFAGQITADLKRNCSIWVRETWNEMQGSAPDQDFVDYVEVFDSFYYLLSYRAS